MTDHEDNECSSHQATSTGIHCRLPARPQRRLGGPERLTYRSTVAATTPTDEQFRDLLARGELSSAATLAVESFEEEISAYLRARLVDEQRVADVYSMFLESLWVGLPGFEYRCSMRGWCFALARNACNRFLGRDLRKVRRQVPLPELGPLEVVARDARSRTLRHLRTEGKDQLAELRRELQEEDQTLLILRVDRRLSWRDIACVLADGNSPTEEDIRKGAARLRKRFQVVKGRLKELAVRRGLLPDGTG